jgi:hypothetical protein
MDTAQTPAAAPPAAAPALARPRFVRPETRTLPISRGDTITVKRRLNTGEQRAMFARMYFATADGGTRTNPFQVGLSTVLAYLVDWTVKDEAGQLVPIAGLPVEDLITTLDATDPETFAEIKEAVEAHQDAQDAARSAEKNGQGGGTQSPATSPSPPAAAGATSGSPNSTQTSTPSSSRK